MKRGNFLRRWLLLATFFSITILSTGVQAQDEITEQDKEEQELVLKEDPKNFAAHYIVGAYYYNLAVEPHLATTRMNLNDYLREGKTLEEQKTGFLKQALPYFENAYSIKPDHAEVKEILKNIYQQVGEVPLNKTNEQEVEAKFQEKLNQIEFKTIAVE